jgi:hypothetical protein
LIPSTFLTITALLAQSPAEVPKKPRQMEIKGTLSSTSLPAKMGTKGSSWAESDPFIPAKAQYKIPLKPGQSILAEVKSNRPTFKVMIVEAKGTGTASDAMPQIMDARKNRALFLNRQKKAMEVVVQVHTTESVASEPFTLVLTEIDTEAYLKQLEGAKNPEPKPADAPQAAPTGAGPVPK